MWLSDSSDAQLTPSELAHSVTGVGSEVRRPQAWEDRLYREPELASSPDDRMALDILSHASYPAVCPTPASKEDRSRTGLPFYR